MKLATLFLAAAVCAAAADARPAKPPMPVTFAKTNPPAGSVTVDCAKDNLQAVIDKQAGPVTIELRGTCTGDVTILRKDVVLHGSDPLADGIHGTVTVRYSYGSALENLSIANPGGRGLTAQYSYVMLTNCRMDGNDTAIHASLSSFVEAEALAVANSAGRGVTAQLSSVFQCIGCTFTNNAGYAAVASSGGWLTLLDSTVTGPRGLLSVETGSYADIDCVTFDTGYPCSMNVTSRSVIAAGGTGALYGAGDFTGGIQATERGHVFVYGARQLNAATNVVDMFSTLWTEPYMDEAEVLHESQLRGTTRVGTFSKLVLGGATTLDGSIVCTAAGDAWLDPTVVRAPGSSVTGCEHVP